MQNGERTDGPLAGVRVIEVADEQGEYCGLLLAGLGAEVIKIEPPQGSPTRRIGPFLDDVEDPERSLYFWHYNRAKHSITLDLDQPGDQQAFRQLASTSDVVLDSMPRMFLSSRQLGHDTLREASPALITARLSPFGDDGPWRDWVGSDLVHLALGGPMMNCGYDPQPDGTYDTPPIAPQMWQAFHIAGEQFVLAIVAALIQRQTSGVGQHLTCAIHEAVAKSTELDLMNWIMRATPLHRQTCRHAAETVSAVPTISHTKDGRWVIASAVASKITAKTKRPKSADALLGFLGRYGIGEALQAEHEQLRSETPTAAPADDEAREIPGSGTATEFVVRCAEAMQRLVGKYTYETVPWREAQEAGLLVAPLRRPDENAVDPHWLERGTFTQVDHPELSLQFTDVVSKWVSSGPGWITGRRAPLLGEDNHLLADRARSQVRTPVRPAPALTTESPKFPLEGVRIFDFGWFLATAGGTRFLAALGAEVIKVEWRANPDSRIGAMAPVGGRAARRAATGPLPGVTDSDMGGQFLNKNSGKLGISLNVRDPRGLEIAKTLVQMSDIVSEGFSPGVLDRWGLGYDELRRLKPDIIYAQQSGMGAHGRYGRFRSVGPIAAAFAGVAEMSGLPSPAMPAGWGYSYLDWIGAYSFALAMLSALHHRNITGEGQWIDASQCETGLFVAGTAYLDWSVNQRIYKRVGNRSPYKPAAPHGAFRCRGTDSWLAIACFDQSQWQRLCAVAERPEWLADPRFATLAHRLREQDALEIAVEAWTTSHDAYDLMERLQAVGVPAGVCQTAADRCERDPQLAHLGWLAEVTGTKIGTWPIAEVPFRMSGATATVNGRINRGAPCYGEDNDYVYGELLGLSKDEIAGLAADGVI